MKPIHCLAPLCAAFAASRIVFACMLFLAMSAASTFAIAGQEIVFVTEIHGDVSIKGRAEPTTPPTALPATLPIKLLDSLAIGTIVQLQKNARLVVFYPADSAEYRVQGLGSYLITVDALQSVEQAPLAIRRGLPAVYRDIKVRANSLVQAGTVLRNAGTPAQGMRPSAEKIDPTQISFRWNGNSTPGTRIALFDKNDVTLWDALATAPPMMLPTEIKLAAGDTYRWQLVAPNATRGRQPWAEFEVLSTEMAERIRSARPPTDAPVSANIAFALLLDSCDATSMAQDVWSELARKYPNVDITLRKSSK
jgi:hypothetical protein